MVALSTTTRKIFGITILIKIFFALGLQFFSYGSFAQWSVTYSPPSLINPIQIQVPKDVSAVAWPSYSGHCAGEIYSVKIPPGQDAVISQSGNLPLDKPVWIVGGRNVRVLGLDISIKQQPGCDEAKVLRVPGGMALRIEQSGTSFVEGLKLDLNGHAADCIVSRNYQLTEAQALANRNVYIQNSACRGATGTHAGSPGGNYLHADFFQNQGTPNDPINRVVFENISQKTAASGVVLDGKINEAVAINYEFALDLRYEKNFFVLNPLWMTGDRVVFKNIYTDFNLKHPITGNMPSSIRVTSLGSYFSFVEYGVIKHSPEIHHGVPAKAFAPWDKIGLMYVSPH